MLLTNDKNIRLTLHKALDKELLKCRKQGHEAQIIEELGVQHGTARIDLAIVNGVMHGYEIKSDCDTLDRLPEQVVEFSKVFDKITLVVGKQHLYQAMYIIPDWWGVKIAKADPDNHVFFQTIRKPGVNPNPLGMSIARLLWREEALNILEERNLADGIRFKPREAVYQRLVDSLNIKMLKQQVRSLLITREGWRSDVQLRSCGD
jgi:hypothetical protein